MGSIYLIRHGQASFGADDYDVLSPTGIRQAEILGDHLLNLGVRFDRVLSGGLRRQQHTARAALERLESSGLATPELEVDPAFNEFEADAVIRAHLPDLLEEQPEALHILRHAAEHRAEFQRLFSTIIARWVSGNHEKDGLESWQEFLDKVHDGSSSAGAGQRQGQGRRVYLRRYHYRPAPTDRRRSAAQGLRAELADRQYLADSPEIPRRGSVLASFNSHVHLNC